MKKSIIWSLFNEKKHNLELIFNEKKKHNLELIFNEKNHNLELIWKKSLNGIIKVLIKALIIALLSKVP